MNIRLNKVNWSIVIRMLADALMLQLALSISLILHFFYKLALHEFYPNQNVTPQFSMNFFVESYLRSVWLLLLIALPLFYFMGFYTFGKYYQSKYRLAVILQAVTQTFLIFAYLPYLVSNRALLPRSALIIAFTLSCLMLAGSRLWSWIWESIVHPAKQSHRNKISGKQRNVLIIGGAGYIGSSLIETLLDNGHRVRVLDMLLFGTEPLKNVINHPKLEIIQGDFRRIDMVSQALQGMDSVVHLGAIVGDPACNLDEDLTIDVNLSATRMIGDLAKAVGIQRFIFASTCSVYGACDEILDERSHVRPISLYGQTKLASEKILLDMASDSFKPTIVRFATIYGLSGRTRFDLVVNLLTAKAKMEGLISVFGGDQWRPFVHVSDAARGVATLIEAPLEVVANQIYNVGSNDQNYTISQIGELVHEKVIGSTIEIQSDNTDPRNYRVNFNKIYNQTGFVPEWTVEDGIQQVLEAIANGEIEDYQESKYSNVKFLSKPNSALQTREAWEYELIQTMQER